MAKHTKSGKTNKNLLMHIKNSADSVKESTKCTVANRMPGYTDDSQHHLKYIFTEQCENLEQRFANLRNDQMEIVKKLDILESRRWSSMVNYKCKHDKHMSPAFEETLSSALSALDHASNKRDSVFGERLQMLRRTHTSLVNDNRITSHKNIGNVNVLNTRSLVYFSNVQHFRTILSASEHHGECVAFQEVDMGATSENDKRLVIQSASPKRKLQTRQLRRFKTDTKEDNRIVSYEAQIEHVKDKKSSQNRTQAKEVTRQNDHFTTEPHTNKTETKTKLLSTEKSMTKPRADESEFVMPKSNTVSEYSRIGLQRTLLEESGVNTATMLDSLKSELNSRLQQALGNQFDDSEGQFNALQIDEETMKAVLESSGNDLSFGNMSLMSSWDMASACYAEYQEEICTNMEPDDSKAEPVDLQCMDQYMAKKHRHSGHSVETVICLDTSESIKGPLWTKAITFAKNFIKEVIHHPCGDPSVFERIGLVTFGHETRVQVHLTRHYHEILSKLDTLSPSGPTPMAPGLKMCAIALEGAGSGTLQMNTMSICPRIILITDGKTTPHIRQDGPDITFTEDLDETVVMHTVQEIARGCHLDIDCVALGESKIDFLTKISQSGNGKIYKCEDWKKLGRRTKFLDVASRIYRDFLRKADFDFVRNIIRTHWDIKGEDLDIVEESMRRSKATAKESSEEGPSEEKVHLLEDQLLLIGTRVRRGPDWEWGDQDSEGVGTIVGYDKNNWVIVVWDNYDSRGRNSNMYRYEVGLHFDVVPVEEPRVLSPGERIAVGCKVKRGKDWKHGDQDGGLDSVGTVIKKGDRSDKVTVRWPNRKSHKYKFGKEGQYEIQLCDTHESYTPIRMTEKVEKSFKETEHLRVKPKKKELDVEEMNRRNLEMSKGYIGFGSGVKENSSLKPENSKVRMDADVPKLKNKNIKQNKNRR